ncbi:MAG TPA: TIGR03086 family metal-binding protein [Patescibacteria group bacterium]|nr:TIGR03086 family metal-binding protein [Patescibacteria group bacterium]
MKKTVFETALDMADEVINEVSPAMLRRPTPCTEWDLGQLLNHLYNELAWVPELAAGKTIAQVGAALDGDLVGADPRQAWQSYAATAREAASKTPPEKVVHLSYGNVPAQSYFDEMAADITVHTWDVAQSLGLKDFHIDNALAEAIYNQTKKDIADWRKAGLVGEEKPVAAGATAEAKLIALFGR